MLHPSRVLSGAFALIFTLGWTGAAEAEAARPVLPAFGNNGRFQFAPADKAELPLVLGTSSSKDFNSAAADVPGISSSFKGTGSEFTRATSDKGSCKSGTGFVRLPVPPMSAIKRLAFWAVAHLERSAKK